jgi:predicted HicB family RNase H-like nuclease
MSETLEKRTDPRSESRSAQFAIRMSAQAGETLRNRAQERGITVNAVVLEALGLDPKAGE